MAARKVRRRSRDAQSLRAQANAQREAFIDVLTIPRGLMNLELDGFRQATMGRVPPPILLPPETLRYMAERSKTFASILYRRNQQIATFCKRPMFDGDTGFEVVLKDRNATPSDADRAEAYRIEEMLLHTGTIYNPERTDNLRTAVQKMLYSSYIYDAIVIEPCYNETGQLDEWFVLDGGQIQLTDPNRYEPTTDVGRLIAPVRYVQVVNEEIRAEWSADELIYVIRNPSPTLERYGYGQPELELLVDIITIEVEVLTWAKMVLSNSSVPDGLILLKSNREDAPAITPFGSAQSTQDLRRQWRTQISGAQNAGTMAVLQIPRGDDAAFFEAATKSRDMPFGQLYELAQNTICAYLGAMSAEVGIVEGTLNQASFVDSDAKASQLRYSRTNGLGHILGTMQEVLDLLVDCVNPRFCVQWRGVDHTAEEERLNLEVREVEAGKLTLNELRALSNKPLFKGKDQWWADVPAIPAVLQIIAAQKGLQMNRGGFSGAAAPEPEGQRRAKPGVSGQPGSRRPGTAATRKPTTAKAGDRKVPTSKRERKG